MSSTRLLRKSLDKYIGAEGVNQAHAKTSWTVDTFNAIQSLVPTWHTLRRATVADMVGCLFFWESAILTRHPQRLFRTGERDLWEGMSPSSPRS